MLKLLSDFYYSEFQKKAIDEKMLDMLSQYLFNAKSFRLINYSKTFDLVLIYEDGATMLDYFQASIEFSKLKNVVYVELVETKLYVLIKNKQRVCCYTVYSEDKLSQILAMINKQYKLYYYVATEVHLNSEQTKLIEYLSGKCKDAQVQSSSIIQRKYDEKIQSQYLRVDSIDVDANLERRLARYQVITRLLLKFKIISHTRYLVLTDYRAYEKKKHKAVTFAVFMLSILILAGGGYTIYRLFIYSPPPPPKRVLPKVDIDRLKWQSFKKQLAVIDKQKPSVLLRDYVKLYTTLYSLNKVLSSEIKITVSGDNKLELSIPEVLQQVLFNQGIKLNKAELSVYLMKVLLQLFPPYKHSIKELKGGLVRYQIYSEDNNREFSAQYRLSDIIGVVKKRVQTFPEQFSLSNVTVDTQRFSKSASFSLTATDMTFSRLLQRMQIFDHYPLVIKGIKCHTGENFMISCVINMQVYGY